MSSNTSNALNAIGTLIGYIGTEVATDDFFDRLLWPQRSYNGFCLKHIVKVALLMPMGGPLHKAALSTLDDFYKHGLYERHQLGHMLGTAFYRDSKLKYKAYGSGPECEKEYVRNGLWTRAVMNTPFPTLSRKGSKTENGDVPDPIQQIRQKICVSHLRLFELLDSKKRTKTITIPDDAHRPTFRTYLVLVTTELTAIMVSILVAVVWRSAFAALWLLPLTLKLISCAFAVNREGLVPPATTGKGHSSQSDIKLFATRDPSGGFVIIEGREQLVLQFFRHYGHPKRSKGREFLQIALVVVFTMVFPIGLLCSTLWMTDTLQKVWVAYQLYATLVMYVYRYAGGHMWCTSEERIGGALDEAERLGGQVVTTVELRGEKAAVGATLARTCHDRFREAQAHTEQLIAYRKPRARLDTAVNSVASPDSSSSEEALR